MSVCFHVRCSEPTCNLEAAPESTFSEIGTAVELSILSEFAWYTVFNCSAKN